MEKEGLDITSDFRSVIKNMTKKGMIMDEEAGFYHDEILKANLE